jgi:uncharacterized protein (DUF58 family)
LPTGDDREFLDPQALARLARLQVLSLSPMAGTISGLHKSPHRGSSVEFAEYRKYVPGDDTKNIDWRVYARSDRFYMKEFEADTNLRCYLGLDCSGSMAFGGNGDSKFAYARRLAATLAYLLMHQGDAVGLTCFGEKVMRDIPPRHNASHLRSVFNAMGAVRPRGGTQLVPVLHDLAERIRRRALVIVFSDFFTEVGPLLDCFQHLRFRKHDLAVFHLMHRTETRLDFDRPIRFSDMESSFNLVSDPETIQNRYREEVRDYLDRLKRGCDEFKVDYRLVFTDTSYEEVLADFLVNRIRKQKKR